MLAFIAWYLILTPLGWLTFPLVHRLFPALPDRGYTLARAAGLLIWGYVFWILATFGFIPNHPGGLLLGLLILAGLSVRAALGRQAELMDWVRGNLRLIIT